MDEGPSKYELLGPSDDRITVTLPIDRRLRSDPPAVTLPTRGGPAAADDPRLGPIPASPEGRGERVLCPSGCAVRKGPSANYFSGNLDAPACRPQPRPSRPQEPGRSPQRRARPCGHRPTPATGPRATAGRRKTGCHRPGTVTYGRRVRRPRARRGPDVPLRSTGPPFRPPGAPMSALASSSTTSPCAGRTATSSSTGFSATVPDGRSGLVGANGTGKSTLLRLLAGDLRPTAGTVSAPAGSPGCARTWSCDDRRSASTRASASPRYAAALRRYRGRGDRAAHFDVVGDDWDLEDRTAADARPARPAGGRARPPARAS